MSLNVRRTGSAEMRMFAYTVSSTVEASVRREGIRGRLEAAIRQALMTTRRYPGTSRLKGSTSPAELLESPAVCML